MYKIATRTRNLIPFPYEDSSINSAITTFSPDGKVTINGVSTYKWMALAEINSLVTGKQYTFSGCPSGGSASTYYMQIEVFDESGTRVGTYIDRGAGNTFTMMDHSYVRIYIAITKGYTANNLVFEPMLNEGETALPFEPYIQYCKPVTRTRNLIPFPYKNSSGNIYKAGDTFTQRGVTVHFNTDGSITMNGTNDGSESTWLRISNHIRVPAGVTLGLSGCSVDNALARVFTVAYDVNEVGLSKYNMRVSNNETKFITLSEEVYVDVYVETTKGETFNNVLFKPMLYIGDTALPFEPYIQRYNIHIKENLFDIDLGNPYIFANCSEYSISEDGKTIIATGNDSKIVTEHVYSRGWVRLYNKNSIKLKKDDRVIVFADITLLEHRYGEASIVFHDDGEYCRATQPSKRYISAMPTRVSIRYRCLVSEYNKFKPVIAINSNRVKIENVEVYKLA